MFYAAQPEAIVRSTIGDSLYNVIHEKTGVEPGMSHHYYEIMRADSSSAATVEYYKQLAITLQEAEAYIRRRNEERPQDELYEHWYVNVSSV